MEEQGVINYERVAKAIEYIKTHFKRHPDLDEVAAAVHLSPSHFQRLFTDWAGTSPKKFLQYISVEYAKKIISDDSQLTLFDVAHEAGFSGTSRLHDLFVSIEGMTPAEYKNGGKNLVINFEFYDSPFGRLVVASTSKGVCYMAFTENDKNELQVIRDKFPNADFRQQSDENQKNAILLFKYEMKELPTVKLHLKGTDFQLKVWESLLKIPMGKLATYGILAEQIGNPGASRAVGTAIGSNPVAFLIPCHRVIQSTGIFGGYMWGNTRKTAIIGWEAARK